MNLNQFTQKSVEAIQAAQQLAGERQNQQIRQEHLLLPVHPGYIIPYVHTAVVIGVYSREYR